MNAIFSRGKVSLSKNEVSWIIEEQILSLSSAGTRARALIKRHDLMDDRTAVAFIRCLKPQFDAVLCEALERTKDPSFALNEFIRLYWEHLGVVIDWTRLIEQTS